MVLPEVEARLRVLAIELTMGGCPDPMALAAELEHLADQIPRRRAATHAPVSAERVTAAKVRDVLRLHALHPDWTQAKLAKETGLNQGRISEILAGKRK